jgi:hypothetical protein
MKFTALIFRTESFYSSAGPQQILKWDIPQQTPVEKMPASRDKPHAPGWPSNESQA